MVGQADSDDDAMAMEVPPAVGAALGQLYAAARTKMPQHGCDAGSDDGGDGSSTSTLKVQVAELKEEVQQLTQEVGTHRQVLEQFIEVRDGCMELLTHREGLLQCLELRDGVQAVLGSARILSELGDKTAELDLSLAGVSDNTARHGKALSNLAEQQKRTAVTLDAIVRAVKRLDRSRSRSREGFAAATLRSDDLSAAPMMLQQGEGNEDLVSFSAPPTSTHAGASAGLNFAADADSPGRDWWDAPCGSMTARGESKGEATEQVPWVGDAMDAGQNGSNAPSIGDGLAPGDPWHWPGWSVGQNDEPEILQQSNDDLRIGSAPSSESPFSDAAQRQHSTASDSLSGKVRSARRSNVAPNSARGSSSGRGAATQAMVLAATSATGRHHRRGIGGSGNRSATPRSGRPGSAVEAKRSGGCGGSNGNGIPDPSLGGPGDLGADYRPTSPGSENGPQSNAEMAHCVKGVLARIEEALTKLDGSDSAGRGSERRSGSAVGTMGGNEKGHPTPMPTPRAPESWDSASRRSGCYARGQRMPSRPQSASVRRSGKSSTTSGGSGPACTQRRRRGTDVSGGGGDCPRGDSATGSWRMVDSWA